MKLLDRARQLAALTPAHRNRYVDWLRAISITVVVLGHWLMAVITVEDGRLVTGHLLGRASWAQVLTWLFQVMPVFFMVGAFSNASSWTAAERAGGSYADWLRARCQRLLGPTAMFALSWVPLVLGVRWVVDDPVVLASVGRLAAVPMWFLAVYLMVVPFAPPMLALHRRFGVWVPVALTLAAALVDALAMTGPPRGVSFEPSWTWINFAFVWLAVHQLGFFWWDGGAARVRWMPWALGLGGFAGLVALTASGVYPVSMIGWPGAQRSNNTPPTAVLVLLAAAQLGLILASNGWANRRLARVEPWARTIFANGMIMTIYLWHVTAMLLVVILAHRLGWRFLEPFTVLWWASRLFWIAILATALALFVAVFGRFERPRASDRVGAGWPASALACTAALLAAVGLASLAAQGFYRPQALWHLPLAGLVLLVAGAALIGVRPAIYRRA